MTTVAFTNTINVRTTAYGNNGSFCSKEYDAKVYRIRPNQLELIKKVDGEDHVETTLPMSNVLAITNLKNCFVWWCTNRHNQGKNSTQASRKYLIIDVPSHHDVKSDSTVSREFDTIDQYMAIEIVIDSITDFRYIVYKKSDFIATFYDSDCGTPMLLLRNRKRPYNILIPAKRVIDVTNADKVHGGNGNEDCITDFEPKLDIV